MQTPRVLPTLLLGLSLSGCAQLRVDEQGRRHVVGFVWLTLPAADVQPVGADALRMRALGVSVVRTPAGASVVLGYGDHAVTVIRNDSLVKVPTEAQEESR